MERAQAGCFCAVSHTGSVGLGLGGAWNSGISEVFISPRQRRVSESPLGLAHGQLTLGRKAEAGNESLVYSALRLGAGAVTASSTSN